MTDHVPSWPLPFLPPPQSLPWCCCPQSSGTHLSPPTFPFSSVRFHFDVLPRPGLSLCSCPLLPPPGHPATSLCSSCWSHFMRSVPSAQPWRLLLSPLMSLWSSLLFSWPLCILCSHPLNPDYHHSRRMWLCFFRNVFFFNWGEIHITKFIILKYALGRLLVRSLCCATITTI